MLILAVETSASTGSVALWREDDVVEEVFGVERNHAAELAPRVRTLVGAHGGLQAVDAYAISIGPGSFTGLRIGVSFVKGLAAIHPRPAVGISTLRIMAVQGLAETPAAEACLAIQDARRGEVFAGLYRADGTVDPALTDGLYSATSVFERFARRAGKADRWPVIGDAVDAMPSMIRHLSVPIATPRARTVGRLGFEDLGAGLGIDAGRLDPAYHQRSAAEVNLGVSAPDDSALHLDDGAGNPH